MAGSRGLHYPLSLSLSLPAHTTLLSSWVPPHPAQLPRSCPPSQDSHSPSPPPGPRLAHTHLRPQRTAGGRWVQGTVHTTSQLHTGSQPAGTHNSPAATRRSDNTTTGSTKLNGRALTLIAAPTRTPGHGSLYADGRWPARRRHLQEEEEGRGGCGCRGRGFGERRQHSTGSARHTSPVFLLTHLPPQRRHVIRLRHPLPRSSTR